MSDGRPLLAAGSVATWFAAARPKTLPVAVAPVVVGTAVAWSQSTVLWPAAIAALVGALAIQVGTNFANDVFDFEKGADDADRLGPARAVQSGLLAPSAVKIAMGLSFALALVVGVYLVSVGGPAIIVIGVASILSGILYTAGPYPLGYHGLGDVFVFVFFGFVAVLGTTWVVSRSLPPLAWLAALPVGTLATAVLVVNNARDYMTDARAGKRTLVVRFGRRFATWQYATLVAVSHAAPLAMVLVLHTPPTVLLSLATAPWGVQLARRVARAEGRALNPLLPATAGLLLVQSALLALGILLAGRTP